MYFEVCCCFLSPPFFQCKSIRVSSKYSCLSIATFQATKPRSDSPLPGLFIAAALDWMGDACTDHEAESLPAPLPAWLSPRRIYDRWLSADRVPPPCAGRVVIISMTNEGTAPCKLQGRADYTCCSSWGWVYVLCSFSHLVDRRVYALGLAQSICIGS